MKRICPKRDDKNQKLEDSLWTTDDLTVLRQTFSAIKANNYSLKSRVAVLEQENGELREKLSNLETETKKMPGEISLLEKENQRLYIRVADLETAYASYHGELSKVDVVKKQLEEEIDALRLANQTLIGEKMRLEYELNKSEARWQGWRMDSKLEWDAQMEKSKLKADKQIQRLKEKAENIAEKYENEKRLREKAKQALDHLRMHFSGRLDGDNTNDRIDDKKIKMF